MELTPNGIRAAEFRGARRDAYHHEDVDEFVELVATGYEALLEQLRLANERVSKAEAWADELRSGEDELRRTLLSAQRLADTVMAEAREEAARLRTEAGELRSMAEVDVERRAAAARDRQEEVACAEAARLVDVRSELLADIARLRTWADEQRAALRRLLVDGIAGLDAEPPLVGEPPALTEVDLGRPLVDEEPEPVEPEDLDEEPAPVDEERVVEPVEEGEPAVGAASEAATEGATGAPVGFDVFDELREAADGLEPLAVGDEVAEPPRLTARFADPRGAPATVLGALAPTTGWCLPCSSS